MSVFGYKVEFFIPPLGHGPLLEVDENHGYFFKKGINLQNHGVAYSFKGFTDFGRALMDTDKCLLYILITVILKSINDYFQV